ncbi:hypothetical protein B0T19DRAFT_430088 [Cercophora scortea]|uniref:2EXR domain-containing protein n=1 Tax=Cercophora scortea TaxID=314031 RepID=A0AAE0IAD3_9PEZI|nr:hypothetical protein B0T19DRAFT_430088 [Cercophora scortea]
MAQPTGSNSSFTLFPNLPSELQDQIWKEAASVPRLVRLDPEYDEDSGSDWETDSDDDEEEAVEDNRVHLYRKNGKRLNTWKICKRDNNNKTPETTSDSNVPAPPDFTKVPPLMFINHASRQATSSIYTIRFRFNIPGSDPLNNHAPKQQKVDMYILAPHDILLLTNGGMERVLAMKSLQHDGSSFPAFLKQQSRANQFIRATPGTIARWLEHCSPCTEEARAELARASQLLLPGARWPPATSSAIFANNNNHHHNTITNATTTNDNNSSARQASNHNNTRQFLTSSISLSRWIAGCDNGHIPAPGETVNPEITNQQSAAPIIFVLTVLRSPLNLNFVYSGLQWGLSNLPAGDWVPGSPYRPPYGCRWRARRGSHGTRPRVLDVITVR